MAGEEENKGFKVTDRRVSAQQEPQPPAQPPPQPAESSAAPKAAPEGKGEPVRGPGWEMKEEPATPQAVPPMDFTTFCLSLASSAMVHLGLAPYPETGQFEKSLPLAKQTIDILAMLEEKTRNNLTPEESKLIATVLYDLRMRFVEARR